MLIVYICSVVPLPNVSVRAVNQTVGDPLSLECNVKTVKGITSNVDISWMANEILLRKENGNVSENRTAYTYSYYDDSKRLTLNDSNTIYSCHVIINTSPPVDATNNVTLVVGE